MQNKICYCWWSCVNQVILLLIFITIDFVTKMRIVKILWQTGFKSTTQTMMSWYLVIDLYSHFISIFKSLQPIEVKKEQACWSSQVLSSQKDCIRLDEIFTTVPYILSFLLIAYLSAYILLIHHKSSHSLESRVDLFSSNWWL